MTSKTAFVLAYGFWLVSFILCIIAYGTGYWFEAKGENRLFKRLGLWETCFDGYEHTSDYIGKAYYGCWWIFHKEYSYVRDWIMPSWFIAVQTLMTFAVVVEFVNLVLIPMAGRDRDNVRLLTITVGTTLFGMCCLGVSVTIFAVMIGEDRTWMPRPDIDKLSWSFGLAVVAGFAAAFSCISITVYTLMRKYDLLPKDDVDYQRKPPMLPMVPRV
ncbi:hypothetical protein CAPTEDRAFT_219379 [Capitella teleta]|uniref:Uncharacterized protein n=1 Tax=Capitella teleta TaxID=283909 RepID=R7TLY4_CAPTE|nr:hypothetical protein CAPTEDRAFT_219379 [Capitella teleta]|eukprot:ELT92571.1 hypothetical protein CAPTEDRAFT_219379 [Capitella teleta]